MMDRRRKAFWLSLILTGAGQLYLGEKRKGFLFLLFSLFGILISCAGAVIVLIAFMSARTLTISQYNKFLVSAGSITFLVGLFLILVSGFKSIKDTTTKG
jgi:hypothetical protein